MVNRTIGHRARGLRASLRLALFVVWVLIFTTKDASAYIDPSAGGMLVQLLLAGTAGVAVLGKLFWSRIKRMFGATDSQPSAEIEKGEPDHTNDRV